MNNKIVKLTIFLFVVCGLSAFLIAYINQVTLPAIEEQKAAAIQAGYSEVYPEANAYEEADYMGEDPTISAIVIAKNNQSDVGVIYTVVPSGYNGDVETMVGFDIDTKKITGVKIMTQAETPGLGANCKEPWFASRYAGKTAEQALAVVKVESASDNEVQAITAATITSSAITSGINAAQADFIANFGQ